MTRRDPTKLKSKPEERLDVPGDSFLVKVTVWAFLIFISVGFLFPIVGAMLWVVRGVNLWSWLVGLF